MFSKSIFELGQLKNIIQDGNKEWITILVTIYINRITLLLGLIYQAVTSNI